NKCRILRVDLASLRETPNWMSKRQLLTLWLCSQSGEISNQLTIVYTRIRIDSIENQNSDTKWVNQPKKRLNGKSSLECCEQNRRAFELYHMINLEMKNRLIEID